uniref:Odorant-binding protein 28 n=1 Tax=Chouioia cunea TaxID=1570515 RepID=A0A6B9CII2_9HYME|nr:odorant-binding protein 28 [Chouioia cunea]
MNIRPCIAGILSVLVLVQCETSTNDDRQLEECLKEIGATKDSFTGPPNYDDPKVKCLQACYLKKNGMLIDGKAVADKLIDTMSKDRPKDVIDLLKAYIPACVDKANEEKDECELGEILRKCILRKIPHLASQH